MAFDLVMLDPIPNRGMKLITSRTPTSDDLASNHSYILPIAEPS